ncbi:related to E.coli X-Pro aminopeptidase II [Cephalotrichum gorgonifer]|uniref:Xaa-Pro aminopeptidase n=1 Tax=Cephalotrichum gorgonifer TaxID=2041049 RepID=A0AAE8SVF5_9PEZI|nr:related to E.coli X-Pro aminopeptidase II [Cephalotrichum gorgonifer]
MKAQARAFRTGGSISTKGAASTTNHLVDASELQFGQPLHETHPHLLESGELTPGITAQEYHDRRVKLCEHLPKGSVAILEASTVKWATSSVFYPHVQDLNFLYLTGFQEDNAVAVIEKVSDDPEGFNFYLFVQAKNPAQEQWAGARSGVVAARDVFNADIAHDVAELSSRLPGILKTATSVYSDVKKPKAGHESTRLYDLLREGAGTEASLHLPSKVLPLSPVMDDLRMVKSPAEIANMRKAGKIAGRAITNLMRREWLFEQDIAAALEYDVKSSGCTGLSFIPVVAGGRNTSCVHYVHNNAAITPESLILVDAGGEYGRYVSDITRVWPQHGKFTTAQRDLYEALLTVQRRCVSLSRENAELSLNDLHREARTGLMAELERLGFPSNGYRYIDKLFNHHVGHYVGMDVHDCMGVSRNIPLKRGHCITIEPGVYVPNDSMFPKHFHGMGMRIEDSVAIDAESVINLTVEAVKEVADIENLRE